MNCVEERGGREGEINKKIIISLEMNECMMGDGRWEKGGKKKSPGGPGGGTFLRRFLSSHPG